MYEPTAAEAAQNPQQVATCHRYTDDDFWAEAWDEESAHEWFVRTCWPHGVQCPTCCSCDVAEVGNDIPRQYRCRQCEQDFSIVTGTLMQGLDISFLEWRQAIFIFTGEPTLTTSRELARRIGWDDGPAREALYRLLQAAAEPARPLREPAELDWTELQYPRAPWEKPGKVRVIALVGRESHRVAGMAKLPRQSKYEVRDFVHRHLVEGMMLSTDSHRSNRDIPAVIRGFVDHSSRQWAKGPACTNLPEGLWKRVKRVLQVDFSWYHDESLTHWLHGLQWWENHRHLNHPERMLALARGMRWKKPGRINTDQFPRQNELGGPRSTLCADCQSASCRIRHSAQTGRKKTVRADASRTWREAGAL